MWFEVSSSSLQSLWVMRSLCNPITWKHLSKPSPISNPTMVETKNFASCSTSATLRTKHELTDSVTSYEYLLSVNLIVIHLFTACQAEILFILNEDSNPMNCSFDSSFASSLTFSFLWVPLCLGTYASFTLLWVSRSLTDLLTFFVLHWFYWTKL